MKITLITALVAGALLAGASQAAANKQVIRFLSVQVSAKQTSANVVVINNNDLINGKKVGHDTLTCKLLSARGRTAGPDRARGREAARDVAIDSPADPAGERAVREAASLHAGAKGSFSFNLNAKGNRTSVVVTLA